MSTDGIRWSNVHQVSKLSKFANCGRITGKPEATFSRFQADSDDVVPKSASRKFETQTRTHRFPRTKDLRTRKVFCS